ncbi:rhomboid family intramembrane serine protease [Aliikangiella sp. G2MR2-5]|uniref:rhomboid family intramembrane serine protease n=1 Tax=Aliikangiella sp. G2MR2-5 TaxID=2788943 RepID=UPI0018AB9F13|nr:rhomboid family intramembrane serine protease [Aliikangiella sp. G2MR2-5]
MVVYFILFLWVIKSAEELFNLNLWFLAIRPDEVSGLAGIFFAPLLHSDWGHLAANSFPLFLLGSILFYGYPRSKWKTIGLVWFVSGVGVWLFGRPSYHLGASGLVSGFFYFIFIAAILRRDKVSIALMFIAVLLFGSVLLGILPWDPKISFESHFFGAVGGVMSAFLFRNLDPKPQRKVYEWEGDEEKGESDIWREQSESQLDNQIEQMNYSGLNYTESSTIDKDTSKIDSSNKSSEVSKVERR